MKPISSKLLPVSEEPAEESFAERAGKFVLPRPLGTKQLAWLVYERDESNKKRDYTPHVLQRCPKREWTGARARLVDIARANISFVRTHYVFDHKGKVEVYSQKANICLADVIETTIMTEEHASAILTKVGAPSHL